MREFPLGILWDRPLWFHGEAGLEFWAPAPGIPAGSDGIFPLFQPLRVKVPEQFLTDIGECGILGILGGKRSPGAGLAFPNSCWSHRKVGNQLWNEGNAGDIPNIPNFPEFPESCLRNGGDLQPCLEGAQESVLPEIQGQLRDYRWDPKMPRNPGKTPSNSGNSRNSGRSRSHFFGVFFSGFSNRTKRTLGLGSLYGENELQELEGNSQRDQRDREQRERERAVAERQLGHLGDIL